MNTVNPFSDFEWHRSSFCASGACVEVAVSEFGDVLVSDSKRGGASPFRGFSSDAWARVLDAIRDGCLPDGVTLPAYGTVAWGVLEFTNDEWDAFVAGVKNGEFDPERLSSPTSPEGCDAGEVGPAGNGPDLAATGAGAIAVPPAPVAAQPRYILDKDAILSLVERYGDARAFAADRYEPEDLTGTAAVDADDLLDAIRGALTPVPVSEPEPAWGSGPLVKHVTETPGTEPEGAQQ